MVCGGNRVTGHIHPSVVRDETSRIMVSNRTGDLLGQRAMPTLRSRTKRMALALLIVAHERGDP